MTPKRKSLMTLSLTALLSCGDDGAKGVLGTNGNTSSSERLTIREVLFEKDGSAVALLLRPDGRMVQLPIGGCTIDAVYDQIHDIDFPRPRTYDLFKPIADQLGLEIDRVTFDIVGDSITADVIVVGGANTRKLIASPGDAIAIAQRTSAAIIGSADLLDNLTMTDSLIGIESIDDTPIDYTLRSRATELNGAPAARASQSDPVAMHFLAFAQNPFRSSVALMLIDEDSTSVFTMIVSVCQAMAFYEVEEEVEVNRSLAHQLLVGLVEAGNATVSHATIVAIHEGTFIGELGIRADMGEAIFDARPSDAVTLARLSGAPIRINADLFAQHREDAGPYLQKLRNRGKG